MMRFHHLIIIGSSFVPGLAALVVVMALGFSASAAMIAGWTVQILYLATIGRLVASSR